MLHEHIRCRVSLNFLGLGINLDRPIPDSEGVLDPSSLR
jgi:hypothetical protein